MKKLAMLAALMTAVAVLDGCSAGGTEGKTSTGTAPTPSPPASSPAPAVPTLTLALSSTAVSTAAPATISAKVSDATGTGVAGVVVSFAVSATVGKLTSPATLTDATGVATDTLSPASTSTAASADTVVATATVAGTALTASAGYQTSASGATFTSFTAPNLPSGKLTAYNQTNLSLQMAGVSASAPVTLTITSDCVGLGKATITPASTVSTTGDVTFVYQDKGGCGASLPTDNITVTAAGATPPSKTLNLPLVVPVATSVSFISSDGTGGVPKNPSNNPIFLKGATGAQSSTVTFTVVDIAGNPLPNQEVTLNLTTFAGGLLLDGDSQVVHKNSDSLGQVSVIVSAGTVPTPVSVLAVLGDSITGPNSTVSSVLAIGTGLPTEARFAVTPQTHNIEGFDVDNAWDGFTVAAADRSGNPVPPGTAISFWAESGQIPASVDSILNSAGLSITPVSYGTVLSTRPADGHVTILSYAIGEESFQDLNQNNVWDAGEPFQDLGDPFRDVFYDGIFSSAKGDEAFSLSSTGVGGTAACVNTGAFVTDASIPMVANTCDGTWSNKVYVRRAVEIVLSTSTSNAAWPDPSHLDGSQCPALKITRQTGPAASPTKNYYRVNGSTYYLGSTGKSAGTLQLFALDNNGVRFNPVAQGTTIAASAGPGMASVSVSGGQPVIDTTTPTGFSIDYDLGTNLSGTINLAITSPGAMLQPSGTSRGPKTTTTLQFFLSKTDSPTVATSANCPLE